MKINKSVIVQPQVREWWLRTQHPDAPELVKSWVDFRAWIDKDISKIGNEVKSQKILSNVRSILERVMDQIAKTIQKVPDAPKCSGTL